MEKSKPRPKRPDALALLHQIETGGSIQQNSPKLKKRDEPTSSKSSSLGFIAVFRVLLGHILPLENSCF